VGLTVDSSLVLSGFQAVMTLTLDRVIRHTVVHQSSTSIYIPISLKSEKILFWRRT